MIEPDIVYNGCKIKDIFLASYLQSLGFVSSLNLLDAQRPQFDFPDVRQPVALSYFSLELPFILNDQRYTTSPDKIFLAYKDLRKRIQRLNGVS